MITPFWYIYTIFYLYVQVNRYAEFIPARAGQYKERVTGGSPMQADSMRCSTMQHLFILSENQV